MHCNQDLLLAYFVCGSQQKRDRKSSLSAFCLGFCCLRMKENEWRVIRECWRGTRLISSTSRPSVGKRQSSVWETAFFWYGAEDQQSAITSDGKLQPALRGQKEGFCLWLWPFVFLVCSVSKNCPWGCLINCTDKWSGSTPQPQSLLYEIKNRINKYKQESHATPRCGDADLQDWS